MASGGTSTKTGRRPADRSRPAARPRPLRAPKRPLRRRWIVGAVALAAPALALSMVVMRGGGSGALVASSGRPLRYQVLYRTESIAGGQDVTRWETLTVARPFEAADFTYDARPTVGVQPTSGYASTERALYDLDGAGLHLVAGRQPGVPSGDQDLITQLPDLLARHLAADTGALRSVAGRPGRVYRLFEPP